MATPTPSAFNLTSEPTTTMWPPIHYIFIEKIGPFLQTAPQAWTELHKVTSQIAQHNQVKAYTSLYKVPEKIYRAGVAVATAPKSLPEGLRYELFPGGKYSKFVLTGAYANLPQACGRVFELVAEKKIPVRDDFNIENYVNDPRVTPEDQLITEILIPTV